MRCGALLAVVAFVSGCSGFHVDVEPPPNAEVDVGCAFECHGAENSNAPPKSVSGSMETTSRAVGAHQPHLAPDPLWHLAVKCEDCHVVPTAVEDIGHMDGDNIAEVVFSARAGGASVWDGTSCTAGCHGNVMWGGARTPPMWTLVDGSQAQCGSCHGNPPPAPHPPDASCAKCHPTMEDTMSFRDPTSHINGTIDVIDPGQTGGCVGICHGSTNAAPPVDISGSAESPKVGAHQAHLKTSTWRRTIPCSACHVVPLTDDAAGHRDGDNVAEVDFNNMNPQGTYAAGTCSNQYCHGNGRNNNGTASWTSTTVMQCGSCHSMTGNNMSGAHDEHIERNVQCSRCHSSVIDQNRNIINAGLHINGQHDVRLTQGIYNPFFRSCSNTQCHGTRGWYGGGGGGGGGGGD